ncbi:uncharacterized protein LOC117221446 isoform X14 [Megalopta genalis]|uniref:uncharacterized protein LOC117221446 isoform X14 n=1 Tax=Megalopta genalis TaxID=115081 RepID=UPI003FD5DEEC
MAIMQSCCCWRSVRRGSFACAVYTGDRRRFLRSVCARSVNFDGHGRRDSVRTVEPWNHVYVHTYLLRRAGANHRQRAPGGEPVSEGKSFVAGIRQLSRVGHHVPYNHEDQRGPATVLVLRRRLQHHAPLRSLQGSTRLSHPVDRVRDHDMLRRRGPLPLPVRRCFYLRPGESDAVHAELLSSMPEHIFAVVRRLPVSRIYGRSRDRRARLRIPGSSGEVRDAADDDHRHVLLELPTNADQQRDQNDGDTDAESYGGSERFGEKSGDGETG